MDRVVTEWFAQVLQESPAGTDQMLSTRGRLALLLADMPGKWQDQFLRPGPWPEEFVSAMRETYLRAGPDFQLSKMAPAPAGPRPHRHPDQHQPAALRQDGLHLGALRAAAGRPVYPHPLRF